MDRVVADMNVDVVLDRVTPAGAALLDNLWQFYELESSFWSHEDVDPAGRFTSLSGFLSRLGDPNTSIWAYFIRHQGELAGFLLISEEEHYFGRTIAEFADLYVLPKYRGRGVATAVIRRTMLASNHPWLVCSFKDDHKALAFWERAFARLPFAGVREVIPPDVEAMRQFVVNDAEGV